MSNDELLTDPTDEMLMEAMAACGVVSLTQAEVDEVLRETEAQSNGDWLPRSWWIKELANQIRRVVKNRDADAPIPEMAPEVAVVAAPPWERRVAPPAWVLAALVVGQIVLAGAVAWLAIR